MSEREPPEEGGVSREREWPRSPESGRLWGVWDDPDQPSVLDRILEARKRALDERVEPQRVVLGWKQADELRAMYELPLDRLPDRLFGMEVVRENREDYLSVEGDRP